MPNQKSFQYATAFKNNLSPCKSSIQTTGGGRSLFELYHGFKKKISPSTGGSKKRVGRKSSKKITRKVSVRGGRKRSTKIVRKVSRKVSRKGGGRKVLRRGARKTMKGG